VHAPNTGLSVGEADSTFERFLDALPDAIVGVKRAGTIVIANQQAAALFGYPRGQLVGQPVELLVPDRFKQRHPGLRDGYFSEPRTRPMGSGVELYAVRKDGTEFPVEISLSTIETKDGTVATAAIRDISARAEGDREQSLVEELNQARRLESVGQLAGGIAHDFNNLLGVILNAAQFVADELEPGSPAHDDVEEIQRSAERAAALTRQLLIFSRREVAMLEVLDLGEVIAGLENLLHRALGERVELETMSAKDLAPIEIDPGQLEQVLVNLSVNARDAMPEGGRLIIEAENAVLDEEFTGSHPSTKPGAYVRLKVSDTGTGMDEEALQRAYEPFFTTKAEGKGTGLGLATVYGIVTSAGGRIDLYSELGMGTTVKVHLPAAEVDPGALKPRAESAPTARGQVVLVVEDESDVRRMAERILTHGGYSVIGVGRGAEALEICSDPRQAIDLVLTDVIMPEMLGTELIEKVTPLRPGLPVLFMSGYSHAVLAPETLAERPGARFIEKPFSRENLLRTVAATLNVESDGDDGGESAPS
jgi:PAS domain S-box-containing protein